MLLAFRTGSSAGVNELLCGSQDHPRSRGVYDAKAGSFLLAGGSSPLARGLPARALVEKFGHRIIPARAGFTREHSGHVQDRWGSSPLARGLHAPVDEGVRVRGIIPARAGFTSEASARACHAADHPRSRGVYAPGVETPPVSWGSSPLARGLPLVIAILLAP